jgi:hypothetical protein
LIVSTASMYNNKSGVNCRPIKEINEVKLTDLFVI